MFDMVKEDGWSINLQIPNASFLLCGCIVGGGGGGEDL